MIPRRWRLALQWNRWKRQPPASGLPRKFILFSKQRSGSTWVIDLLNSHPEIVGFAELFLYDMWGQPPVGGDAGILAWNSFLARYVTGSGEPTRRERDRLYNQYLDESVFASRQASKAIGFKLMYNQAVSDLAIPKYLQQNSVSCVHLIRRNHLDAVLSAEAVRLRGLAHAETNAPVRQVTIHLEPESIELRLQRRDREIAAASEYADFLGLPVIELVYEELSADITRIIPVLEFLGVDSSAVDLTSRLRKLNSKSHRELISNYDDIARALHGSRFAHMLRDE